MTTSTATPPPFPTDAGPARAESSSEQVSSPDRNLDPAAADLSALHRLEDTVARVVRGKRDVIRMAVVALLADGHLLIEDVPGVGKTTLARTLARALGLAFQRIQFTSDLLPSDIIGVSVYRQEQQTFEFVPGPLFANIVLADEINRATPKTQSALLEAMGERRVSVERRRYQLSRPFLVLATQNPLEYLGTFPLPESQLDRFLMSLNMGYPPRDEERRLLLSGGVDALVDQIEPALTQAELVEMQNLAQRVKVTEKLADYMLQLAEATRKGGEFALPVSTRGVQGLFRATQALALCEGRGYAVPDDVQRLAVPVLGHRVTLKRGAGSIDETREAIRTVLSNTPVPL